MPKTKPQPTKREVALDRQNQELRKALSEVQRILKQHIDAASVQQSTYESDSYLGSAHRVAGEALKTPAAGS